MRNQQLRSDSFCNDAAPLATVGFGFDVSEAVLGIRWHVLAMLVPSLFAGKLISQFGQRKIIAASLIILMMCSAVALAGITLEHFYLALILFGLDWNFGFIGSTALLIETCAAHEKYPAQGLNDSILLGSMAIGSLSSGVAYKFMGWELLLYRVSGWTGLPNRFILLPPMTSIRTPPPTSGTDT